MQEESITFVKQLISSLEQNMELMKNSIKGSEKEKFTKAKEESLKLKREIDNLFR